MRTAAVLFMSIILCVSLMLNFKLLRHPPTVTVYAEPPALPGDINLHDLYNWNTLWREALLKLPPGVMFHCVSNRTEPEVVYEFNLRRTEK